MNKPLPLRKDVPVNETWDLSALYVSDDAYFKHIDETLALTEQFNNTYLGRITDVTTALEALKAASDIFVAIDRLGNYAELRASVDKTDDAGQNVYASFSTSVGKIASNLSFLESELLALSEDTMTQLIESAPYKHYLTKLKADKVYQLHPEVEATLARLSSTLYAFDDLYGTTKMLDVHFEPVEFEGQTYEIDYPTFENEYEDNPNIEFRRQVFKHFSDGLRKYQHTTAATYNAHVQREKTEADLRGYDSVIDFLLHSQEVSRDMFDRQIDVIIEELGPVMQRYAKLIQRVHGIEEMRFEDLKISIDPEFEPDISIEESKSYIFGALDILGEDYKQMLNAAYEERWIDFAQNKGKDTGAYCASPYATHSFIFISWTGKMAETFVLAHELGHAGHFTLAQETQPFLESESSLYFVEAPSTMNEMLMANYLFNNSNDSRFKRWVIGSIVSRTYYHNMVTHLLEAAYQREVYNKVDAGESLTAPVLNEIKKSVYQRFFGDAITYTEGMELTWMRQPHYYMGLYPYTYSAGLTIGTVMSQRIKNEGKPAVEDWLRTLKAGGSVSPVALAEMAGIDITTDKPLRETIAYISSLVDELEALTDELDKA